MLGYHDKISVNSHAQVFVWTRAVISNIVTSGSCHVLKVLIAREQLSLSAFSTSHFHLPLLSSTKRLRLKFLTLR